MVEPQTSKSSAGGATFLLDFFRTRPWAKRVVSVLSALLLIGGVALLAYPFATNLYQNRLQDKLSKQFASQSLKQKYRNRAIGVGDSLTRIKVPAIRVDVVVVEGVTPTALRAGAGHYPQTPLPCEKGNVAIAGHRTTYGKPFADIDQLRVGDQIELDTPIGGCVYQLKRPPFVVDKSDLSVLNPTNDKTLTLTSCHPKGSAAKRIIVKADWVKDL
ncbi:MAG: class E sortase, partial [Acidimicrobiia bacterium]|nr:class E sortase [Acidimicrobiia bacterium]